MKFYIKTDEEPLFNDYSQKYGCIHKVAECSPKTEGAIPESELDDHFLKVGDVWDQQSYEIAVNGQHVFLPFITFEADTATFESGGLRFTIIESEGWSERQNNMIDATVAVVCACVDIERSQAFNAKNELSLEEFVERVQKTIGWYMPTLKIAIADGGSLKNGD